MSLTKVQAQQNVDTAKKNFEAHQAAERTLVEKFNTVMSELRQAKAKTKKGYQDLERAWAVNRSIKEDSPSKKDDSKVETVSK